jgi:alkylation response protein AidB-like acyl-CoA dehydrogenase
MLIAPLRRVTRMSPVSTARELSRAAALRVSESGDESSFPANDVAALEQGGLLRAPFPGELGGEGLAGGPSAAHDLFHVLRALGGGSLSLGRLYEGHVNAVALVARYGTIEQLGVLAGPPGTGALLAVWNTDDGREPLRLVAERDGWRLIGCKVLCSGAGFIERPLVTARDESGRFLMVVPRLRRGERADLAAWTPTGMQASATGRVDFTGLHVTDGDIVGDDDDYHRQPAFSGGAWRFLAVQLGAMETVLDLCRRQHTNTGRGKDPHQAARFGQAAIAVETARLWSERAAFLAEVSNKDAEATVAYVNLARLAVERAALDLMELVQRSIGLSSFIRPHPIERVIRDLSTYLRQPAPDRALVGAAEWVLNCARAAPDIWP